MIAKAKAISHGINDLRYITGESQHKKHPEKIYRILDNLLSSEPDAMGIWNSMQLTLSQHRPIKNSVIRIELSPSPEHTQFYDIEDWQNLWQDFAEEFDKQVITGKDGKVRSYPTNLAGSKYSVWLHTESKGEVPHLHAAVCRLDENGNINNDHNIHLRAQRAAERVAKKRGWTTAAQIRNRNIPQVNRDCMEVQIHDHHRPRTRPRTPQQARFRRHPPAFGRPHDGREGLGRGRRAFPVHPFDAIFLGFYRR